MTRNTPHDQPNYNDILTTLRQAGWPTDSFNAERTYIRGSRGMWHRSDGRDGYTKCAGRHKIAGRVTIAPGDIPSRDLCTKCWDGYRIGHNMWEGVDLAELARIYTDNSLLDGRRELVTLTERLDQLNDARQLDDNGRALRDYAHRELDRVTTQIGSACQSGDELGLLAELCRYDNLLADAVREAAAPYVGDHTTRWELELANIDTIAEIGAELHRGGPTHWQTVTRDAIAGHETGRSGRLYGTLIVGTGSATWQRWGDVWEQIHSRPRDAADASTAFIDHIVTDLADDVAAVFATKLAAAVEQLRTATPTTIVVTTASNEHDLDDMSDISTPRRVATVRRLWTHAGERDSYHAHWVPCELAHGRWPTVVYFPPVDVDHPVSERHLETLCQLLDGADNGDELGCDSIDDYVELAGLISERPDRPASANSALVGTSR